jgi:hypothetical protein
MNFSIVTGVIDNPPEDLLSLAETEQVLSRLGINQDEGTLIGLLGGDTRKILDLTNLEAAVKVLRNGRSKERREAKKILNSAGPVALDFFKKLQKDSDPEVSETAKSIVLKSQTVQKKAKQAGLTEDVLKLLAIRRLTELKSTRAVPAITIVAQGKGLGLVREAKRALGILSGNKLQRTKRQVAVEEALKSLPEGAGFAAVFDTAEPEKSLKLKSYLVKISKMNLPGMSIGNMIDPFHESLPKVLRAVGNPQVDAVVMAVSKELGVKRDSGWGGFIFKGQYNVEKIKKTLERDFDQREFGGHTYYVEKWGPSFFPVNQTTFIMSFGSNEVQHMEPFIRSLNNKSVPEKFSYLNDTSTKRLLAMGDFSKEQSNVFLNEIKREMKRLEGREKRPDSEAQKVILEVGLLLGETKNYRAFYENNVLTFIGNLANEDKAAKLVATLNTADEKIRLMLKDIPIPLIAQTIDTTKPFTKSSSTGKAVTLRVKADLLNMLGFFPYMMGNMDHEILQEDIQIEGDFEGFELEEVLEFDQ